MRILLASLAALGAMALGGDAIACAEGQYACFMDEGWACMRKRTYAACYASFEKAATIQRSAEAVASMAKAADGEGRLAHAVTLYVEAASLYGLDLEAATPLRDRAELHWPKIGRITLQLDAGAPRGARADIDGVPTSFGRESYLEPGPHKVRLVDGDREVGRMTVTLAPGEKRTLTVTADAAPAAAPAPAPIAPPPPPDEPSRGLRTAGLVVGGVGVVGVIGFVVTGVMVVDADGDAQDRCASPSSACDAAVARGEDLVAVNAVFTVVGALGLVGGGALLLADTMSTPEAAAAPTMRLVASPRGAFVQGRF